MRALFRYELKSQIRTLLIWAAAVGGMGLACILMFKSMESSIADMAENFASMGGFSEAFGMSTLNIATLPGFFATEVGTIHALGGALFAASIATIILSKEEDGHTAEFTYALPVSRLKVIGLKFVSVFLEILVFSIICTALYCIGFVALGEKEIGKEFFIYMIMQFAMDIEIASGCFLISSISKKNKLGLGISLALVLYLFDLIARAIPNLKKYIFITPFSYSNSSMIFSKGEVEPAAYFIGAIVFIGCVTIATVVYDKRDLAS